MIKTTTRLKKCFAVLRARREVFNRRGQVAVFYALLIPILLFVGGVGLDLGWYYLNVSRLQNAADASVLVGASTLTKTHDLFKSKSYKVQLVDKFPAGSPAYDTADNSKKNTSGKLIDTTIGDEAALKYAKKNLEDNSLGYAQPSLFSVAKAANDDSIKDGYTRGNNEVKMTTGLYQEGEDYFYVVGLSEDIHHFFVGFLKDMNAGVVSVALISQSITDDPGGGNGGGEEPPNKELTFNGNGGTFPKGSTASKENVPSPDSMGEDDTITLVPDDGLPSREGYTFKGWNTKWDGSGKHYNTNQELTAEELEELINSGGKLYAEWIEYKPPEDNLEREPVEDSGAGIQLRTDHDSNYKTEHFFVEGKDALDGDISIGFAKDVLNERLEEWDPDQTRYATILKNSSNGRGGDSNISRNRIHGEIAINATSKGDPNDPIYVFIRPEYSNLDITATDLSNYKRKDKEKYYEHAEYTTTRQIVIHINEPNIGDDCRPLIFIYDEPPMISKPDTNVESPQNSMYKIRDPKPIILNINGDFKGGVYAPCTSVIVEGHSHNFNGFVVAKNYVEFVAEPSTEVTGHTYYLGEKWGSNGYIYNQQKFEEFLCATHNEQHQLVAPTDRYGNVLYKKEPISNPTAELLKSKYHLGNVTASTFGFNGTSRGSAPQNNIVFNVVQ